MSYRIRFIILMIRCFLSKPRGILDSYEINLRVVPLVDTDVSRLFTQTYACYLGLARWHYTFSSQFKNTALKNKWVPVTTRESITYKKSIRAFEKVTVKTNLICWDDRKFYLRQAFFVNGEERAYALVEGLLRSPKGHLNPQEVFKVLGVTHSSPPTPNDFQLWIQSRS